MIISRFAEPLAFMFSRESDLTVVGEAGSLAEARELLLTVGEALDVVLVDLQLPDGDGVTLIDELQDGRFRTRVLVLTADPTGFTMPAPLTRVRAACSTRRLPSLRSPGPFGPSMQVNRFSPQRRSSSFLRLASQAREHDRQARATLGSLTPRELQVLEALVQGMDNKAIADRLFISHDTARTHVVNLLAKLNAESRLQAAIFAIRNGIGSVD